LNDQILSLENSVRTCKMQLEEVSKMRDNLRTELSKKE
jgi:hypothetical protein